MAILTIKLLVNELDAEKKTLEADSAWLLAILLLALGLFLHSNLVLSDRNSQATDQLGNRIVSACFADRVHKRFALSEQVLKLKALLVLRLRDDYLSELLAGIVGSHNQVRSLQLLYKLSELNWIRLLKLQRLVQSSNVVFKDGRELSYIEALAFFFQQTEG